MREQLLSPLSRTLSPDPAVNDFQDSETEPFHVWAEDERERERNI